MKVKKVSNLNRYMCHEIRNEIDIIIVHAHFSRNLKTPSLKTSFFKKFYFCTYRLFTYYLYFLYFEIFSNVKKSIAISSELQPEILFFFENKTTLIDDFEHF